MIRFIKETGETFDGVYPYIHWLDKQLSTGLWYTIKLMFVSDQQTLQTSELPEDSIYRFINQNIYDPSYEGVELDLSTISARSITSTGVVVHFDDPSTNWYIHQILLVCSAEEPGEYIEKFKIGDDDVAVGVDLYELDETLQINLENRGLELPTSIQKAFLNTNIDEPDIDYALLNRKFKELISNFIDIVDCKGSYKSLYNSLKWFEWGDGTKLYEVWQGDNMYLEKELRHTLTDIYSNLLFTHRKTTHLSLVAAAQKMSSAPIITDPSDPNFNDRNPEIEDVLTGWTKDELALKVSLLGAFFERYFMPIHLDLKRACIECLVTTNQIKLLNGTITHDFNFHEDTGILNIEMDHTVTLGNFEPVAVGKNTVFGKRIDKNATSSEKFIIPIGVDYLTDIIEPPVSDYSTIEGNENDVAEFYMQLKGGVGVVVPVTVKLKLPAGDAIRTEIINIYRYKDGQTTPTHDTTTDYKLYVPDAQGNVSFSFKLVSTEEEKVSFCIMLVSSSGHMWTRSSSYQCVDPRGSWLDIYKVTNGSAGAGETWSDKISNYEFTPYNAQFNPQGTILTTQYLPYIETVGQSPFNQLIVVQNIYNQTTSQYETSWMNHNDITSNFWVMGRSAQYNVIDWNNVENNSDQPGTDINPKYAILITKQFGKVFQNKSTFISLYSGLIGEIDQTNIKRFDLIYVPQLHNYNNIENGSLTLSNYTFTQNDLLCAIPQFRNSVVRNIDTNSVYWEYENKTTLKKIKFNVPAQTPLIANTTASLLTPGYWTVTMYYKLDGSTEVHKLTKNSAFKIV